jgi:hypothetical protein
MNSFVTFIKKNPVLLTRYVGLGVALVDKAVSPLNRLMSRLLEVQGIDPSTKPGDRERKALIDAMDRIPDPHDFDTDFDLSRFRAGKLKKVNAELKDLNLTMDKFRDLTDLTNLSDKPAIQAAVAPSKREDPDPLQELADFADRYNVKGFEDAVLKIKEYAEDITASPIQVTRSRQPTAVAGGNKAIKGKPKTVKTFKKVVFRRVDGK